MIARVRAGEPEACRGANCAHRDRPAGSQSAGRGGGRGRCRAAVLLQGVSQFGRFKDGSAFAVAHIVANETRNTVRSAGRQFRRRPGGRLGRGRAADYRSRPTSRSCTQRRAPTELAALELLSEESPLVVTYRHSLEMEEETAQALGWPRGTVKPGSTARRASSAVAADSARAAPDDDVAASGGR